MITALYDIYLSIPLWVYHHHIRTFSYNGTEVQLQQIFDFQNTGIVYELIIFPRSKMAATKTGMIAYSYTPFMIISMTRKIESKIIRTTIQ